MTALADPAETPVVVSMEAGLKAVTIGLAAERSIREKRAGELDGLN